MKAKLGDTVSPFAVEKLVLGEGEKAIVGVLSSTIEIVKVHFIPGIGFLHCFEGQCCNDHGISSVRYGLNVVKYQTDGKLTITGDEVEFRMLVCGISDYKNLLTKDEILKTQGADLTKKDLLVTCIDSTYQKKQFDVLGDAKWRKLITKEIYQEEMTKFITHASQTFGRVVDLPTYVGLMNSLTAAPIADRPAVDALRRSTPSPGGARDRKSVV